MGLSVGTGLGALGFTVRTIYDFDSIKENLSVQTCFARVVITGLVGACALLSTSYFTLIGAGIVALIAMGALVGRSCCS